MKKNQLKKRIAMLNTAMLNIAILSAVLLLTFSGAARAQNAAAAPGILIAEPVVQNADEEAAQFGAGCGRWLFWAVGGLPQLGSTPAWSEVNGVETQLKRKDLRLTKEEGLRAARALGVSHLATGSISGQGEKLNLSYQLWSVQLPAAPGAASLNALGEPLVAAGSYDQIIERLPVIAREIATHLNIKDAALPEKVGASSVALAMVGKVQTSGGIDDEQHEEFTRLAQEFPLANLMVALYDGREDEAEDDRMREGTLRLSLLNSPDNTFMWGVVGPPSEEQSAEYERELKRRHLQFPQNYQLARALVIWKQWKEDVGGARETAETAAVNAPQNPYAHLLLANAISDQADSVRNSRLFRDMSAQEQATVRILYPLWEKSTLRAANLTGENAEAWLEVAQAATFNSHRAVADQAIWKALELDPEYIAAYSWGLQMFQPKWRNDDGNLWKLTQRALEKDERVLLLFDEIMEALETNPALAPNLIIARRRGIQTFEKILQNEPNIAALHFLIGKLQSENALALMANATANATKPDKETLEVAAQSLAHFKSATVIDPAGGESYLEMGRILLSGPSPDLEAARLALVKAGELLDSQTEPIRLLGRVLIAQTKHAEAEKVLRRAINLEPGEGRFYADLALAVLGQDRRDEAREIAKQAQDLQFTEEHAIWKELGIVLEN